MHSVFFWEQGVGSVVSLDVLSMFIWMEDLRKMVFSLCDCGWIVFDSCYSVEHSDIRGRDSGTLLSCYTAMQLMWHTYIPVTQNRRRQTFGPLFSVSAGTHLSVLLGSVGATCI